MSVLPKSVGVLSFFGPFKENKDILKNLNIYTASIKTIKDLDSIDALIIPGTEITALENVIHYLLPEINNRIKNGMPLLLTGEAVMLLDEIKQTAISYKKCYIKKFSDNSEWRYQEEVRLEFSDSKPYKAEFIKPPKIDHIPSQFDVLASKQFNQEEPIAIKIDNIIATTFYPEFSNDYRIHEYLLTKI